MLMYALACTGDASFCVKTQSELKDLEVLERARRQLEDTRPTRERYEPKGGGKGKSSDSGVHLLR